MEQFFDTDLRRQRRRISCYDSLRRFPFFATILLAWLVIKTSTIAYGDDRSLLWTSGDLSVYTHSPSGLAFPRQVAFLTLNEAHASETDRSLLLKYESENPWTTPMSVSVYIIDLISQMPESDAPMRDRLDAAFSQLTADILANLNSQLDGEDRTFEDYLLSFAGSKVAAKTLVYELKPSPILPIVHRSRAIVFRSDAWGFFIVYGSRKSDAAKSESLMQRFFSLIQSTLAADES